MNRFERVIIILILVFPIVLVTCGPGKKISNPTIELPAGVEVEYSWLPDDYKVLWRVIDIPLPTGYTRVPVGKGSFGEWLRYLPLKEQGSQVKLFSGDQKGNQLAHYAIVDLDVDACDLQQCADAVMRLRAEYFYFNKEYDKIHFNFVSGFNARYNKWREGYRIKVSGNKVNWVKTDSEHLSYASFRKYMLMVFSYASTLSLEKELVRVPDTKDIEIGDVFIKGGSPGHAILVLDVAADKDGNRIFIVGQSYMPAQEFHVLRNYNSIKLNPWYPADFGEDLLTPEWTFKKGQLKRFEE